MLRIIPMHEATGIKGEFAVWDTVCDTFVKADGEQTFTIESIKKCRLDEDYKKRIIAIAE